MLYSFARIGAVVAMKVEDVFFAEPPPLGAAARKRRKLHDMPCNHNAEAFLHAYIDGTGMAADAEGPLFRTVGRDGKLTANAATPRERLRAGAQARCRCRDQDDASAITRSARLASRCFGSLAVRSKTRR